jgi:hypothetical protein
LQQQHLIIPSGQVSSVYDFYDARDKEIEALSKEVHGVYCKYYREIKGEEYWTHGNYELLDEQTKEADRYMARFIFENFNRKYAGQVREPDAQKAA